MEKLPSYEILLTGDEHSLIPLNGNERQFVAAVSQDDPPTTAYIVKSSVQFPQRIVAQLRENLKKKNIQVVQQYKLPPEELEKIYASSKMATAGETQISHEYERQRDDVRALLARAVEDSVSDIHIVRRRKSANVSFRIAGQIHNHTSWSKDYTDMMCRFIYEVLCQDQAVTWNRTEPQDAVLDIVLPNGGRVRVRIGTIPASPDGYDMVLRILPGTGETMRVGELGYPPDQVQIIRTLTRRPSGLVIMAGSVGSGKSTTIVSMLSEELELHEGRLRIITVEDPPEREIPGATQVPVVRRHHRASDSDFSDAIRGALRCDPDTLMVGEIRDLPSAVLTIKFAQSGHRVYTTLHANTALGIVARLVGLNLDPTLLCTPDLLKGLMYQALVPLLCQNCKIGPQEYLARQNGNDARRRELQTRTSLALHSRGHTTDGIAFRGAGCDSCRETGIKGRTLVSEIVKPDDTMLSLLAKPDYIAAHQHWREELGGEPAIEHGIRAIVAGRVSPADVEFRIGELRAPGANVRETIKRFDTAGESSCLRTWSPKLPACASNSPQPPEQNYGAA